MQDLRKFGELPPAQATLYRAAISVGVQETQLIWTRYTGFIIMNGFIVSALINERVRENDVILLFVALIVFVLNGVWHILNFAGWQNQQLFHRQAGRLFETHVGLVTDHFRDKNYTPIGWIYWLAQLIPTMFSMIAILCLRAWVESNSYAGAAVSWSISVVVWLIFAVCILVVEYWAVAASVRGTHADPV